MRALRGAGGVPSVHVVVRHLVYHPSNDRVGRKGAPCVLQHDEALYGGGGAFGEGGGEVSSGLWVEHHPKVTKDSSDTIYM